MILDKYLWECREMERRMDRQKDGWMDVEGMYR